MKITWLGQGGLYLEGAAAKVLIDPYLSDAVDRSNPKMKRRYAVDPAYLSIKPDIIVLTHDHLDHTDPDTLRHYFNRPVDVLASGCAWQHIRKIPGEHHAILFNRHTEWSCQNLHFTAVMAAHSDDCAIGVVIETEEKRLYITGDTLYHREVLHDAAALGKIDVLFLPINGVGNNMNVLDAARFCDIIKPHCAIPLHYGLYDDIDPANFTYGAVRVLTPYREIFI